MRFPQTPPQAVPRLRRSRTCFHKFPALTDWATFFRAWRRWIYQSTEFFWSWQPFGKDTSLAWSRLSQYCFLRGPQILVAGYANAGIAIPHPFAFRPSVATPHPKLKRWCRLHKPYCLPTARQVPTKSFKIFSGLRPVRKRILKRF